jgi:hypothetical protein
MDLANLTIPSSRISLQDIFRLDSRGFLPFFNILAIRTAPLTPKLLRERSNEVKCRASSSAGSKIAIACSSKPQPEIVMETAFLTAGFPASSRTPANPSGVSL